jgi:pseudouridine-5'-phosphate glycosidase
MTFERLTLSDEVRDAVDAGRPVVVLESSLIAQGLPVPHNLETALASEDAIRESGAVPATVALEDGRLVVGAERPLLERLADPGRSVAKAGSRDLGPLLAAGRLASTTVSATMRAAHLAGIAVFATGGIGGVHRGAAGTFDVSSDIDELAATPVAVVSSGVTHRVDGPEAAARAIAVHRSIPGSGGLLLVQPPPAELAIDAAEVDDWIADALTDAAQRGVRGAAVTPHLLAFVAAASGGRTLRVNIGLIVNNARTAGRVAAALT